MLSNANYYDDKFEIEEFFFNFYFIYKDSYWVELAAVIFTGECQLISCI